MAISTSDRCTEETAVENMSMLSTISQKLLTKDKINFKFELHYSRIKCVSTVIAFSWLVQVIGLIFGLLKMFKKHLGCLKTP